MRPTLKIALICFTFLLLHLVAKSQISQPLVVDYRFEGLPVQTLKYTLVRDQTYKIVPLSKNFCASSTFKWTVYPTNAGVVISSSTIQAPTVKFTQPGSYTLTFQVSTLSAPGWQCPSATKDKSYVISIPDVVPVAKFTSNGSEANKTVTSNTNVTFADASTNFPTSWSWTISPSSGWSFASGNASSKNPVVKFITPGKYSVALKASNSAGNHTITKANHITVSAIRPVADFSSNGSTAAQLAITQNTVVAFADLSANDPTDWSWSLSPSSGWSYVSSNSGSKNPQVRFTSAGIYSVSLTASNTAGSNQKTKSSHIVVAPLPPVVTSTVNLCRGENADALTATGTKLKWYRAATGGSSSTTAPKPSTSSIGTTHHYVSQTVNNVESARAHITVVVNNLPSAPVVASTRYYCIGSSATRLTATGTNLKWYTSQSGTTSLSEAPIPGTATAGTTTYYVSQTNAAGCEGPRASIRVIVRTDTPPPVVVSPVRYVINDAAVPLDATGSNLIWYTTPAGGTGNSTPPTPSTASIGTTSYYVSQTLSGCGESDRAEIQVIVSAQPPPPVITPTIQAKDVQFTDDPSATISWAKGDGEARIVFMAQLETGEPSLSDGTTYTADDTFGAGTEIGTSGWFCIYKGNGSGMTVAGLQPDTKYRIMVVEYNGLEPGTEKYLATIAIGNPMTITTAPEVVVPPVSLSGLQLSAGDLSPGFDAEVTDYSATVPFAVSSLSITASSADAGAVLTVNGVAVASGTASAPVALSVGLNTITVVVSAGDGSSSASYTLSITREADVVVVPPVSLSGLQISSGDLSPGFNAEVTEYSATVPFGVSSLSVTASSADAGAVLTVNGVAVASGAASAPVALSVGLNTITVVVSAGDGSSSKTYTLSITREADVVVVPPVSLSGLQISSGSLSPGFDAEVTEYSATVPFAVPSLSVTASSSDAGAVLTVNGVGVASGTASAPVALGVGLNTITVMVSAGDGNSSKTYTLSVTREQEAIAITSVNPLTAKEGSTVTLKGTGLDLATGISFGQIPAASYTVLSPTEISAVVGAGASGNVTVTTANGAISFPGFNFVPKPSLVANGPTTFIKGGNVVLSAGPASGYTYEWFKDGATIAGANSNTYTAVESGSYAVGISLNSVQERSVAIPVISVFRLPAANFKLSATGTTCRGTSNGIINITATEQLNYTVSVKGTGFDQSYTFANSVDITGLAKGTYTLCITVEGQPDYRQCFNSVITEPSALSVYTAVRQGNEVLLTLSGGKTYYVKINGNSYTTSGGQIVLPLENGRNAISVTTDQHCQGMFEKSIVHSDDILVYPNPFDDQISLRLGDEITGSVTVQVYDASLNVVYSGRHNPQLGVLPLNLSDLRKGMYMLKVLSGKSEKVIKILKK